MKKSIKKLIAIFLVTSITIFSSSIAFALESSSQKISVLPEQKIFDFIEEQYSNSDPVCQWTSDTIIKETIPTYDLDNNINGYILNLSTDGLNTGYMVYDISSDEPILIEFGYDGVYSIEGEDVTKSSKLGQSKLIPVGIQEWVLQDGNDLYTIKTNTKITDQKDEIEEIIEQNEKDISEYVQSKSASTLSTRAQEIYSSVSVPNVFGFGYYPISFDDFRGKVSEPLGCAPICGINMLRYWEFQRDANIFNAAVNWNIVYNTLTKYMKTNSDGGTTFSNSFSGMGNYLNVNAANKPKGDDFKTKPLLFGTLDFNWIKTQINNGNPMYLSAPANVVTGQTSSAGHAFFAVGYQLTSTGDYIRVGTGWDHSFSHFVNWTAYKGNVNGAWYYRW